MAVAGILEGDYRMDGKLELICCSVEGEGITKSLINNLTEVLESSEVVKRGFILRSPLCQFA